MRERWLAAGAVLGVTVAAVAWWLLGVSDAGLRDRLRVLQFWNLEAVLAVSVVCGVAGFRVFWRSLQIRWRDLAAPAASAALAGVLVFAVAPQTNRIYYDEHIYQSIGRNLSDAWLAQMCNDGTVEYGRLQCRRAEYNKQPYAYPHLLSAGYRLFGVSDTVAHVLNGASAIALVWVVYFITLGLFDDRRGAAFASLVAALIPEQLLWSHTAASEPTSTLAAAWTMLALVAFIRLRSHLALAWLVTAASHAMYFRVEMPLLLVVCGAAIALLAAGEMRRPRIAVAAAAGLVLCAVALAHLVSVRAEGWGTAGDRLSLAYLPPNLQVNGWFYLWDARFPAIVSALALVGALRRRSKGTIVVLLWFAAFFLIYLLFYAGSYNYGADVRYSLLTYPPLMILAGLGLAAIDRMVRRGLRLDTADPAYGDAGGRSIVSAALCAAMLFQFTWYLPRVRAVGEEAWGARADVAHARWFAQTLPRNALVLTHNPGMFHLWGVNAAQMSIAAGEPGYVMGDLSRQFAGGLYIHWNFWCNVSDPVQTAFCRDVLAKVQTDQVTEYRERDYRFAFYRIRTPPP